MLMYKSSEKEFHILILFPIVTLLCVQVSLVNGAISSESVSVSPDGGGGERSGGRNEETMNYGWNFMKKKSNSTKFKLPTSASSSLKPKFKTVKVLSTAPPISKYSSYNPNNHNNNNNNNYNNQINHNNNNNNINNVNKEPQWIHGFDQIQIESKPKNRWHGQGYGRIPMPRQKGYDLTTLLAVSLVSAFLGALTFSIVDNGQRSMGNMYSLLNLIDAETVGKVLNSLGDWEEKIIGSSPIPIPIPIEYGISGATTNLKKSNSTFSPFSTNKTDATPATSISRSGRRIRETQASMKTDPGLFLKWLRAYKQDPVELKCIQRLICQTLANSSCAARSINSDFGGTFMNIVTYFFSSAGEIKEMIQDTVGNPKKCQDIAPYDFCDLDTSGNKIPIPIPMPTPTSTMSPTPPALETPIKDEEVRPGSNHTSIIPRRWKYEN